MVDYVAIGQRVRSLRRGMMLTQEELAGRAGITASFLGHIERGSRVMSLETLQALCGALSATPNDLLGMEHAAISTQLPDRVTVAVPTRRQGMADLLKDLQISE